ncbi:MAG: hypothetical protein RJB22_1642 [Pseudomonadota bacterium]
MTAKYSLLCALAAFVSHGPLAAAQDQPAPRSADFYGARPAMAVGAQIRLPLGAMSARRTDVATLNLGPMVAAHGRVVNVGLARLSVSRDVPMRFSLAGLPASAASSDAEHHVASEGKGGPSGAGWVAIALGAVVLTGGAALLITARNVQDE